MKIAILFTPKFIITLVGAFVGASVAGMVTGNIYNTYINPVQSIVSSDLVSDIDYQELWNKTFVNYQSKSTKLPVKGNLNTEFELITDGNGKELANYNLGENFQNLDFTVLGTYDFSNKNQPTGDFTFRIYLNKRAFGLADADISVKVIDNTHISYTLNNITPEILSFFKLSSDESEAILLIEKGKEQPFEVPGNILKDIVETFNSEQAQNNPLVQNTKEQEAKIIQSFLENKVIKILKGEPLEDSKKRLTFSLDPSNFINFINSVGKILGNGNEDKNFDGDKELLKNILLGGTLDINNNAIVDSNIDFNTILQGLDEITGKPVEDVVTTKTALKYPNPEELNVEIKTVISSKSKPENRFQVKLRVLIK